jgi:hypothetical protein
MSKKSQRPKAPPPPPGVPTPDTRRAKRPSPATWVGGFRLLLTRIPYGWRLVAYRRNLYLVSAEALEAARVDPATLLIAGDEDVVHLCEVWAF